MGKKSVKRGKAASVNGPGIEQESASVVRTSQCSGKAVKGAEIVAPVLNWPCGNWEEESNAEVYGPERLLELWRADWSKYASRLIEISVSPLSEQACVIFEQELAHFLYNCRELYEVLRRQNSANSHPQAKFWGNVKTEYLGLSAELKRLEGRVHWLPNSRERINVLLERGNLRQKITFSATRLEPLQTLETSVVRLTAWVYAIFLHRERLGDATLSPLNCTHAAFRDVHHGVVNAFHELLFLRNAWVIIERTDHIDLTVPTGKSWLKGRLEHLQSQALSLRTLTREFKNCAEHERTCAEVLQYCDNPNERSFSESNVWLSRLRLEAQHCEPWGTGKKLSDLSEPDLSDLQQIALMTLFDKHAFDSDSRVNSEDLLEALGKTESAQVRAIVSPLKPLLIASRNGRGGGYYLTEEGKLRAQRMRE